MFHNLALSTGWWSEIENDYFLSPKIPANVVLKSFMVSSPSGTSDECFKKWFSLLVTDSFEHSESVPPVLESESKTKNVFQI